MKLLTCMKSVKQFLRAKDPNYVFAGTGARTFLPPSIFTSKEDHLPGR